MPVSLFASLRTYSYVTNNYSFFWHQQMLNDINKHNRLCTILTGSFIMVSRPKASTGATTSM